MGYNAFFYLLIFVTGLVVGSFLEALTYRFPRGIDIRKGRSFCPHCKKNIAWFDNIPLVSFIALRGRCRYCDKKISFRAPLLELIVGLLFLAGFIFIDICGHGYLAQACFWNNSLGAFALPFMLSVAAILVAIFVIDIENQIIPDKLVSILFFITLTAVFISGANMFRSVFAGMASSVFLLGLHLITGGRGMGLGDVKLAIPAGVILGWPSSLVWLFLSFIIGALVGVILIGLGKTEFGKKIAFGPFLITAFFISLYYGEVMFAFLF